MTLHVMLPGHRPFPKGLCGATVAGFYVSKVQGDGRRRLNLCPVCLALAQKTKSSYGAAATGSAAHS
jgi:hypothetical protein